MTARKYGISFPVAESVITELGEETVLDSVRAFAALKVSREAPGARLIREDNLEQTFPDTDPETGEELPPMRLYRFTYTLDGDEPTPPDGYLDRRP